MSEYNERITDIGMANHPIPRRCIHCKKVTGAKYICPPCNKASYAPLKRPKYRARPAKETGARLTAERMRDPSGMANDAAIAKMPIAARIVAAAIISRFKENTALSGYLITHYVLKGRYNEILTMTPNGAQWFDSAIKAIVDSGVIGQWCDSLRATKPRPKKFVLNKPIPRPKEWTETAAEFQERFNAARLAAVEAGAKQSAMRKAIVDAGGRFV